jgi:hypothetical protein
MMTMDQADLGNACAGLDAATIAELRAIADRYRTANGLLMRLAGWAGQRAGQVTARLPAVAQTIIARAAALALQQSYRVAFATQGSAEGSLPSRALRRLRGEGAHRVATGLSGALGGLGGVATTLVDLPVTTTLILRSVQQIARDYGEDLTDPAVRAQCVAVFALGGPLGEDDAAEAGLFASRLALGGKALAEIVKVAAPRFGIVLGEKALAQATPLLGAVAGGAINPIFTGYYQAMAHVHFRLRRLERDADAEQLRACFERIVRAHGNDGASRVKTS